MFRIALERDELADRLGGGIPRGTLFVIEGAAGTGKTALASRLAYGLLEAGHDVGYVSTESSTPVFVDAMRSLGYGVGRHLASGRLGFVTTLPLAQGLAPGPRLPRLLGARALMRRSVVIVDSFSFFLRDLQASGLSEADTERRASATAAALKRWCARGRAAILTIDPAEAPGRAGDSFRASADALLETRAEAAEGSIARTVLVRRFARPERNVSDAFGFRVEPKVGVVIEIRSVS